MTAQALVLRAIDKRFAATSALIGASLTVRRGTLHAVLGENGAGKTTLMRIAFGMLQPDAGEVAIDNTPATLTSSADAIRLGLGMVHQHFTLVPAMTAGENIALGGHGSFNAARVAGTVRGLVERTGLNVDPDARAATLGVGAQQRVEILKALARNAHILILDEPTAVLTPSESDELFAWLRRFVAGGGTVVLVTHKLGEALAVADDVTVLRRGSTVLAASAADLEMAAVVRAMTGDAPATAPPRLQSAVRGARVVHLVDAVVRDDRGVTRVHPTTLECFGGEVVGVVGVEGSGVYELLRVMAGRLTPSAGTASLPSTIGFVPEDRLRDALIEEFTLTENYALRGAAERRGQMPWRTLTDKTAELMRVHDVRASAPEAVAGTLSGGNQQKFVVGRELEIRPALVVAENPIRGLDLRASEHVLRELGAIADAGSAVIIYSADIDELLSVADRIVVLFGGRLSEVSVDRDAVARAMVGVP